jgi:hypothetical protein
MSNSRKLKPLKAGRLSRKGTIAHREATHPHKSEKKITRAKIEELESNWEHVQAMAAEEEDRNLERRRKRYRKEDLLSEEAADRAQEIWQRMEDGAEHVSEDEWEFAQAVEEARAVADGLDAPQPELWIAEMTKRTMAHWIVKHNSPEALDKLDKRIREQFGEGFTEEARAKQLREWEDAKRYLDGKLPDWENPYKPDDDPLPESVALSTESPLTKKLAKPAKLTNEEREARLRALQRAKEQNAE